MSTQSLRKRRVVSKISFIIPVVTIFRSNKNILAQVIDPDTLLTVHSVNSNKMSGKTKSEKSAEVGQAIAAWLKAKEIAKVSFNRNGFLYHGRVKSVADAIRESGIEI